MTKVKGMETSVLMHSIVVERYSSEEAQYCGGEGPVLMTQRGTIGSGGGGVGRILPSLLLISSQLTPHQWFCPVGNNIAIAIVVAPNVLIAVSPPHIFSADSSSLQVLPWAKILPLPLSLLRGNQVKLTLSSRRASAQAVTSKWQLRTTSPMNTNSSAGENGFSAKNGS